MLYIRPTCLLIMNLRALRMLKKTFEWKGAIVLAEILAYQLGWLNLVMKWDRDEKAGETVITPSPDYKWNQLGGLYQSFYHTYATYSLDELRSLFKETEQQWQNWIDSLSDEELFTQGVRNWTGKNPRWPMVKWIHINSVAPFKTFRSKIRKWKKLNVTKEV